MKRFTANVLSASAGLFGSSLLGLAIHVVVARALGVDAFGVYGFALGYVALWQVLMDGGSVVLATREARTEDAGLMGALLTIKPVMLGVAFAGLVAVARLARFPPEVERVVVVLGLAAAATATMTFGLAIFRGHEEFGVETLHLFGQRMLFGLLVAVVLATRGDVLGVSLAGAISYSAAAASALLLLRRRHGVRLRLDVAALRRHGMRLARAAAPLLVADGFAQVQTRSAQVILQFTSGTAAIGVYVAARRLIEGIHVLPSAFAIALFPRLVKAWRERPERLPAQLRVGLRFTGTLAIGTILVGLLWARELMLLLFSERYAASVPVFRVLVGGLAVMMINAVLTLALIAVQRERAYAIVLGLAAAVNVAGNLALTPWLGAAGSAWATVASEGTLLAGCLVALHPVVEGFVPVREWAWLTLGGSVALAALFGLKQVSAPAAAALTVVVFLAGFEAVSPFGLRDVLLRRDSALDGAEV